MFKNFLYAIVGVFLMAGPVFAQAVDLSAVDLDTDTVLALAMTVVTGLGILWGIRKVIKTINRS